MDRFPGIDTGPESNDKSEDTEEKRRKAEQLGALSHMSVERRRSAAEKYLSRQSDDEDEEPRANKRRFLFEPQAPNTEPKESTRTEPNPDPEDTPTQEPTDKELQDVLSEQLQQEAADLETTLAEAAAGSDEYIDALEQLDINQRLQTKLETPDVEIDETIDALYLEKIASVTPEDIANRRDKKSVSGSYDGQNEALDTSVDGKVNERKSSYPLADAPPTTETPVADEALEALSDPTETSTGYSADDSQPPTPPLREGSERHQTPFGGSFGATTGSKPEISAHGPLQVAEKPAIETRTVIKSGNFWLGGILGYIAGSRRAKRELSPKINQLDSSLKSVQEQLDQRQVELHNAIARGIDIAEHRAEQSSDQSLPSPESSATYLDMRETTPMGTIDIKKSSSTHAHTESLHTSTESQPKPHPTSPEQDLKLVKTPELLKKAEHVYIGGESVRTLYDTNRIDRRGLIALLSASEKGEQLSDVLETVELGRERQRERAREFRHDDPGFSPVTDDDKRAVATKTMAPLALDTIVRHDPRSSSLGSIAPLNIPQTPTTPQSQQAQQQPIKPPSDPADRTVRISIVIAIGVALGILWLIFLG